MVKVRKSKDCKNSPKNSFAQEFSIALLKGQKALLEKCVTEDFEWHVSKSKALKPGQTPSNIKGMTRINIQHAITHGKIGAINGDLHLGNKKRDFCIFLEFSTATAKKVAQATIYWMN